MAFKKDDVVRIVHPLDGKVEQVKFNEDTGEPRYLVSWTNKDGESHHRWFEAHELSKV